ncbi:hypothetical protein ID853_07630 [Xenorhabdus sp. Vera]|uniref:hypothetical protein n=1 Tax=Xenorhabdus koppenhoeferi TaxID=351659 RepID=UPI0019CBF85D|nr:hypothetical protein [Xenorhabdus sp. Vera]MBD2810752.1 hypothetical protein [Xenorhabdus sp. Vera]
MKDTEKYDQSESQSWYSAKYLKIKLPQLSNQSYIFANRRNRIAVNVYFDPYDYYGNKVDVPINTLIKKTFLVDYNTGEKIPIEVEEGTNFKWAYSHKPNEFTAVPRVSSSIVESQEKYSKARITFYVYCSSSEVYQVKQIAVLVEAPDGNHSTVFGEDGDDFVQLTGINEVFYKLPNINKKQELAASQYSIPGHLDSSWEQINIYISLDIKDSSERLIITKLEIGGDEGVSTGQVHQLYHEDNGYRYYYAHFLWPLDEETMESIGNRKWFDLPITFPVDIKVKQQYGFLCFSILVVGDPSFPHIQDVWYKQFYIIIYDQYGNKGKYWLMPNNDSNANKSDVFFIED